MKRKQFSEEPIIRILHEAEPLDNVREVCRQHNVTKQTMYRGHRQFSGIEVADAKRLRTLERENAALKRLVGELTLDNWMVQEVVRKKMMASFRHATASDKVPAYEPRDSRRTVLYKVMADHLATLPYPLF